MVGTPSTALLARPSPATLLASAGLNLATLTAQCGSWLSHSPAWQARSAAPNSS